jgi:hypothetical protein
MALACLIILTGCARHHAVVEPPPISVYRDPGLEQAGVRRILLLPTENETEYLDAASRIREHLATELRATGLFEVVSPPEEAFGDCDPHLLAQGTVPAHLLLEMAHRFNADGVLLSVLTQYHPYAPPRLGVTVHLVSTREGATLVTVDGTWDARNEDVAAYAQQFACELSLPDGADAAPEAVLHTPAYFEKLVARQIATTFVR